MTDIQTAIKELREAIETGEGWPTIHRAYEALEVALLERYGVNEQMDKFKLFEKALLTTWPVKWDDVELRLTALEQAVEGGRVEPIGYALQCKDTDIENDIWECVLSGREDAECRCEELRRTTGFKFDVITLYPSPTPSLTSRIQAAAEEIDDGWVAISHDTNRKPELAAIIRKHVGGGK